MFKRLVSVSLLIISTALVPTTLKAAAISSLDEASVAVDDRSRNQRTQALKTALKNVVLKNSGSEAAVQHPLVIDSLKNPSSLTTQFGYQEVDGELLLNVSFDHSKIVELLRQAQLPVWGKQRPTTLFWLAQSDANERAIISDSSTMELRQVFSEFTQKRAIPSVFPLMDLDDSMRLSVNDVRGMFVEPVQLASERYQTDYFVMAAIDTVNEQTRYAFSLYAMQNNQPMLTPLVSKRAEVGSADVAAAQILSAVSEYYAGRYAIADSGEANTAMVSFVDITNRSQLVEIEKYLLQLSAVSHVSLVSLQGYTAQYQLDLFGTEDDLHRLMKLESRIDEIPQTEFNVEQGESVPEYIWQG
ncbi:DUF2066 domain-containing protein [Shewanella waksmanii]|uniref:DUF2066 domain-containing protein n=1 Tax=Shewanella waksmanii TaxID=213783 RepID=UPI003736317A